MKKMKFGDFTENSVMKKFKKVFTTQNLREIKFRESIEVQKVAIFAILETEFWFLGSGFM